MFSAKHNVKTTLLCGPVDLSKSFVFEAAIYWAEEGRRVVYITPAQLDRLPAGCHDRSNPAPAAFKLMRFMYLENYEALVERLVELHTFATLPSVLLIDDFDAYINDHRPTEVSQDIHIARTCSILLDTMNSCARILQKTVHVCAWSSSVTDNNYDTYSMYFRNIWNVTEEEDGETILLQKQSKEGTTKDCPSFKYCKLRDGTRVLKEVLYESTEC